LDSQFEDSELKATFQNMADAEQRHADIVREIISLVNDASP